MSRDAQHPRGADVAPGEFDIPSHDPNRPAVDGRHDPTIGLFDPESTVRSHDTGRALTAPVLGTGPEIARGPRREPTGRHEILRQAPFAPTGALPTAPPSPLERSLDTVQRWRSPLGLGLAALITVGVVVVYQRSTANDEIAAGDGTDGGNRSAIAAVTDFDETADDPSASNDPAEPTSDVDSTVDEEDEPTDSTSATSVKPDAPNEPASPTTASTARSPRPTASTPQPAPSSGNTSPTANRSTTVTSNPTSSSVATQPTTPNTTSPTTPSSSPTVAPSSSTASTAAPTDSARTEGETGTLLGGATVASDRMGYSGAGFVSDLDSVGDGVSFTVTSTGGQTPFAIGYSAGPEPGAAASRTIGILIDGSRFTSAVMNATPSWDEWTTVGGMLELPVGEATITLVVESGDTGLVAIDYIEVG